jgi:hypothetical protein
VNHSRLSPNGQVFSFFRGGRFEARAEGWFTNDLYPPTRPIFTFPELQGYFFPGGRDDAAVYGTHDPMIVPGLPGQAPTGLPGVAFIATRADFDLATNRLTFHENTDFSKVPDISVILTPQSVLAAGVGTGEPIIGAGLAIDPLLFTGLDPASGHYKFADTQFRIASGDGVFATGALVGIGIDSANLIFTGRLLLDDASQNLDSPFIDILMSNPVQTVLLTPSGTLDLLARTNYFTASATSQTDFIVIGAVPEPATFVLILAACAVCWQRRVVTTAQTIRTVLPIRKFHSISRWCSWNA